MHKFRGSSCLSHTSQSDDVFQYYYHFSKLWSICFHQLPKRGRKCIDHRLQERVCLAFALLFYLSFCYIVRLMLMRYYVWLCGWSYYAYCVLHAYLYNYLCMIIHLCPWWCVHVISLISFCALHQDVCDMEEWPMTLIDCAFAFKCKY